MIRTNYDDAAGLVEPRVMVKAQIGRLKEELHVQIRYVEAGIPQRVVNKQN
jgi:hypothetical protein